MQLLERAINGATGRAHDSLRLAGTPLEKLTWLTEQFLQGMREDPVHFHLFSQAMALSGRVRDTVRKFEGLLTILRDLITQGQAIGEIVERDPDQLALLYLIPCCIQDVSNIQ